MSDGKTHDFITYASCIPLCLLVGWLFGPYISIAFTLAYVFAGLAFNGDLDTESTPYYRWKLLRFIWIPYRKFGHRSKWTHGFLRGTFTRLLWVSPLLLLILLLLCHGLGGAVVYKMIVDGWVYIVSFIIGLECGAMSHTLTDISSSTWKRFVYKVFKIRIVPGFVKKKYKC